MPVPASARLSRQGFVICAAAATLVVLGFLAYEGILDQIARDASDLIYDIMRAVNRE
jgi:hypothetical protein